MNSFTVDFLTWYRAGGDGPYYLWLGTGIVFLFLVAFIGHFLIRRIFGHRKFLGTWYNEQQYHALAQMLYEKQQSGSRVMRKEESELLRQYELGRSSSFSGDSGWRF